MKLEFEEYQTRKIVNVHKHVDGPWFWGKYTAHPYVGCRAGCEFCYSRGSRYLGRRDPETFDTLIQVKINAVERLRKELPRLPPGVIACGDWQQPAESRYRLSRSMLEVVSDLGFPLFIIERSPLVARDVDLIAEISRASYAGALFSISTLDAEVKRAFEPRSPGVKQRLRAMEALARAGAVVGTALMPVIPFIADDRGRLEDVVRATKDHGGVCVVGGGMTMDGVQARRTLVAAIRYRPEVEERWRQMYHWQGDQAPAYGPTGRYNAALGLRIRELCARHGLLDRMPRYIAPGPLAVNKRVAERLFLKTYDLELEEANSYRVWAYRKAAWTVDELPESVEELYRQRGEQGLAELPGVGRSLVKEIAGMLSEV